MTLTKTKFEAFLSLMKQPSTIKGILGLLAVLSSRFGFKDFVTPDEYTNILEGIACVYFAIAILWQDS